MFCKYMQFLVYVWQNDFMNWISCIYYLVILCWFFSYHDVSMFSKYMQFAVSWSSGSRLINFTNHSSYTYYFVILSLVKAKYVTKLYGRMFCLNMQFTMQELGGTCRFHHTMLRYLLENLSNGKNKSILVARYIDVLLD